MTQIHRRRKKQAKKDPFNGATGPHVVMLVHTALGPDTRVVKQLHSLLEHGYRVTALVTSVAMSRESLESLDGVQIIQVGVASRSQHSSVGRSLKWRSPLGFRATPQGKRKLIAAENRLIDRRYQVDLLRHNDAASVLVATQRVRTLFAKISHATIAKRIELTQEAGRARRKVNARSDRAAVSFWTGVQGDRSWRQLWPESWDLEHAYGPVIDRLQPDLIQANDFMMLPVGARAKVRAAAAGRPLALVWDAREFLPGMESWSPNPRWKPAMVAQEREYARVPDRVITVSEPLADLLVAEHRLPERPLIVTNAPEIKDPPVTCATDVRTQCGLGQDVPLIVYSGAAAPSRGIELLVRAMPDLPEGVHLALVVLPPHLASHPYVDSMMRLARKLGVQDRVHALEYVDNMEVVDFLSTGTVGVFPGAQIQNHTISLITKFMEYAHARLPIVVSDLKTMAETVTEHQIGAVFTADDVASYVAAVTKVLADPAAHAVGYKNEALLHEWTWAVQAEVQEQAFQEALARVKSSS